MTSGWPLASAVRESCGRGARDLVFARTQDLVEVTGLEGEAKTHAEMTIETASFPRFRSGFWSRTERIDLAAMKKTAPIRMVTPTGDGQLDGVLDAALEISAKRRETLARLRNALKANNVVEVFRAAEELCGLSDDEKSNRIN